MTTHLVASEKYVKWTSAERKVQLLSTHCSYLLLCAMGEFCPVLKLWKKMCLSLFKSTQMSKGKMLHLVIVYLVVCLANLSKICLKLMINMVLLNELEQQLSSKIMLSSFTKSSTLITPRVLTHV